MSAKPVEFYSGIKEGVKTLAGKKLGPTLSRWRNTFGNDDHIPDFNPANNRFLVRYGLLDAGDSRETRRAAFLELIQQIVRSTGDAPGVVAAWIQAFSAGSSGLFPHGMCGDKPKCDQCSVRENCRYLASGGRVGSLSGKALAQQLAPENEETPSATALTQTENSFTPEAAELIAFTLNAGESGAKAVASAHALLKHFGGLRGLFKASSTELRSAGLDAARVARIRSAAELCQLWSQQDVARGKAFTCSKDFYEHFHLRLRDLKKERFYTVSLDQKHRLLGEELVSEGTLTEALVHPREVFAPALSLRAAAVVVLHNHPSGDPAPSKADKALTERLEEAATLIGIRLLDHLVVGDGKFFSFADEGLI